MTILSKLHRIVGENPAADSHEASTSDPNVVQMRANDKEAAHDMNEIAGVSKNDEDRPTEDAQVGVRQIEAVTLAWGKGSVFTVLILFVSTRFYSSHQVSRILISRPEQYLVPHPHQ